MRFARWSYQPGLFSRDGDSANGDKTLKTELYENDLLLLEWTADSAKTKIDDGIDTFVFKDGFIRAQTVRYTLQRK